MKRESIGIHTLVEAQLTSFGANVLAEYLDGETERATGQANPDNQRVPTMRDVEMPLWELLRVFGPHTVSSARPLFEVLGFSRPESKEELSLHQSERSRSQAQDDLRDLAKALGLVDDYKAPEVVAALARRFAATTPPRVPNTAGWWWFEDGVVHVTAVDGKLKARIRGRWRAVSEDQPWRGPAIMDPRVRKPADDQDQDIPF